MSHVEWRQVCDVTALEGRGRCKHLYAKTGKSRDLALFIVDGRYFAMETWCSHYGGPLHNGDIEDYKGSKHVMCPWHGYMFNLETGSNELGIRQEVFETKVEDSKLYVKYGCDLQLEPYTS